MTRTGQAARPDVEERAQSILDWATEHVREIGYVAVGVVAVLIIGFAYTKMQQSRAANADRKLAEAEQAMQSGNSALAQSDLDGITSKYSGTQAANQASLMLAQLLYDKGQYAQGIKELDKVDRSDKYMDASVENMIGIGYEQQSKYSDAADHFKKAADRAPFATLKSTYLVNAARAYMSGNDRDAALKLWTQLASDPSSPSAAEARERVGELEAKPAKS